MEIKGKPSLGIKILAVLIPTTISYWQDLIIVGHEALSSDIATHILAMPFFLTYLLYRVRRMFTASASHQSSTPTQKIGISEMIGISLCFLAYFIKLFGSYTFHPLEYHLASIPLFVARAPL